MRHTDQAGERIEKRFVQLVHKPRGQSKQPNHPIRDVVYEAKPMFARSVFILPEDQQPSQPRICPIV